MKCLLTVIANNYCTVRIKKCEDYDLTLTCHFNNSQMEDQATGIITNLQLRSEII